MLSRPTKPRLLVLKDACRYAGGISRWKAYRLIAKGKFNAFMLEGRVVVDRATLDRYLRSLPKFTPGPRP